MSELQYERPLKWLDSSDGGDRAELTATLRVLPREWVVGFAVRCARRVIPLLLRSKLSDALERLNTASAILTVAERWCRGANVTRHTLDVAVHIADAVASQDEYSTLAVESALRAAVSDSDASVSWAVGTYDATTFTAAAVSALDAADYAIRAAEKAGVADVKPYVRQDLAALLRTSRRTAQFGFDRLEDRVPPATVTFMNPAGGSWNVASNWDSSRVPASGDDAVIPALPGKQTITYGSGATTVHSVTSSETLTVSGSAPDVTANIQGAGPLFPARGIPSGTTPAAGSSLAVVAGNSQPDNFMTASGATVGVTSNTSVVVPSAPQAARTLTAGGALTLGAGSPLAMSSDLSGDTQAVNGVRTVISATGPPPGSGHSGQSLTVNGGGHLAATNSTFSIGSLTLNGGAVFGPDDFVRSGSRHGSTAPTSRTAFGSLWPDGVPGWYRDAYVRLGTEHARLPRVFELPMEHHEPAREDDAFPDLNEESKAALADERWVGEQYSLGTFDEYRGEYVAVVGKKVLGHDKNLKKLRERVSEETGIPASRIVTTLIARKQTA